MESALLLLLTIVSVVFLFLYRKSKLKESHLGSQLSLTNNLYRSTIDIWTDSNVYVLDEKLRYIQFNELHKREMKSFFNAEIKVGRSKIDFLPEQLRSQYERIYRKGLNGEVVNHEQDFGQEVIRFKVLPLSNGDLRSNCIAVIATNVTSEIRKSKSNQEFQPHVEALIEGKTSGIKLQEEFLLNLIDQIHNLIFVRDSTGKYTLVNQRFAANLGFGGKSEVIGKTVFDTHYNKAEAELYHQEDLRVLDEDIVISKEVEYKLPSGEVIWFFLSKKRISVEDEYQVLGVQTDITSLKVAQSGLEKSNLELKEALKEVKNFQLKLIESEKLATVGQLTAGLIHEINNPINYVSGNVEPLKTDVNDFYNWLKDTQLYQKETEEIEQSYEESIMLLEGIREGSDRVKELMISLKSLSRPDNSDSVQFNINNGLKSTINLLKPTVKERIEFILDLGDIKDIICNPGQIQQVFLNVLDNSIEAIEKNGVIEVETSEKDGVNYVRFRDSGKGISNDTIERVFEPFYTTKEFGHGSGLGLSISKRVMKEHNGSISISSSESQGTTVTLTFPHSS